MDKKKNRPINEDEEKTMLDIDLNSVDEEDNMEKTLLDIDLREIPIDETQQVDISSMDEGDLDLTDPARTNPDLTQEIEIEEATGFYVDPEIQAIQEREQKKLPHQSKETISELADNNSPKEVSSAIELQKFPLWGLIGALMVLVLQGLFQLHLFKEPSSLLYFGFGFLTLNLFTIVLGVFKKISNRSLYRWSFAYLLCFFYFGILLQGSRGSSSLHLFNKASDALLAPFSVLILFYWSSLFFEFRSWIKKLFFLVPLPFALFSVILPIWQKSNLESLFLFSFGSEAWPWMLRPLIIQYFFLPVFLFVGLFLVLLRDRQSERINYLKSSFFPSIFLVLVFVFASTRLLNKQGLFHPIPIFNASFKYFAELPLDLKNNKVRLLISKNSRQEGHVEYLRPALSPKLLGKETDLHNLFLFNKDGRPFWNIKASQIEVFDHGKKLKSPKLSKRSLKSLDKEILFIFDFQSNDTEAQKVILSVLKEMRGFAFFEKKIFLWDDKKSMNLSSLDFEKSKTLFKSQSVSVVEYLKSKSVKLNQVIYVTDRFEGADPVLKEAVEKSKLQFNQVLVGDFGESQDPLDLIVQNPSEFYQSFLNLIAISFGNYQLKNINWDKEIALQILPNNKKNELSFSFANLRIEEINSVLIKNDNRVLKTLSGQKRYAVALDHLNLSSKILEIELVMGESRLSFNYEVPEQFLRQVRFLNLIEKDLITGVVNPELFIPNRDSISQIEFYVNGKLKSKLSSAPFQFQWDTRLEAEGENQIQALITYQDQHNEEIKLPVFVSREAPQLKMLRPNTGEYLDRLSELEVALQGDLLQQIDKVEFYASGDLIGETSQAPYKVLWDNGNLPGGLYPMQAKAYLSSGQSVSTGVEVRLSESKFSVAADLNLSSQGDLYPDSVFWILDSSQSSQRFLNYGRAIDHIRALILKANETLPKKMENQFIYLSAKSSPYQADCRDIEVRRGNSQSDLSLLEKAQGSTALPLANGFALLSSRLKKITGSTKVILISAGKENCGGDLATQMRDLKKKYPSISFSIVSMAPVSGKADTYLKDMAKLSSAVFYNYNEFENLQDALGKVVQVFFQLKTFKNDIVLEKPLNLDLHSVRSGDYRLEVELQPPLILEKLSLPSVGEKRLRIIKQGDSYQFVE